MVQVVSNQSFIFLVDTFPILEMFLHFFNSWSFEVVEAPERRFVQKLRFLQKFPIIGVSAFS
jgi:hypothetical protein